MKFKNAISLTLLFAVLHEAPMASDDCTYHKLHDFRAVYATYMHIISTCS